MKATSRQSRWNWRRETNEWFWPAGRRRKTLEQRLKQTAAEVTNFNTTSAMEHTESVEPKLFSGNIAPFTSDKEEDIKEAKKHSNGPSKISFWTDGSRVCSGHTGTSVA